MENLLRFLKVIHAKPRVFTLEEEKNKNELTKMGSTNTLPLFIV